MIGPDGNTLVPFGYMFFHCLFGARMYGPDAVGGGADGQKGTLLSRDGSFRSGLPTAAQRFVEPYQSKVLVSHGVAQSDLGVEIAPLGMPVRRI